VPSKAGINSAVAGSAQWLTAHERRSTDTDVATIRTKHRPLGDRARVMQDGRAGGLFRSEQNSFNALVDCREIVLLHSSSDVTSHMTRDI